MRCEGALLGAGHSRAAVLQLLLALLLAAEAPAANVEPTCLTEDQPEQERLSSMLMQKVQVERSLTIPEENATEEAARSAAPGRRPAAAIPAAGINVTGQAATGLPATVPRAAPSAATARPEPVMAAPALAAPATEVTAVVAAATTWAHQLRQPAAETAAGSLRKVPTASVQASAASTSAAAKPSLLGRAQGHLLQRLHGASSILASALGATLMLLVVVLVVCVGCHFYMWPSQRRRLQELGPGIFPYLCLELVVPQDNECTLWVPRLLDPRFSSNRLKATETVTVNDAKGLPVFNAMLTCGPARNLVLKSAVDDNLFTYCDEILEGKSGLPEFSIHARAGLRFAVLRPDGPEDKPGYSVRTVRTKRTILFQGNMRQGRLNCEDEDGRLLAMTEATGSEYCSVRIGPKVDAGLMCISLLCISLIEQKRDHLGSTASRRSSLHLV